MSLSPATDITGPRASLQLARRDVRIRSAAGRVLVQAPLLFQTGAGAPIEDFVKRLFRLHPVRTTDVDYGRQTIVIGYDARLLDLEEALREFARVLEAPPCESPLDHLLARASGAISRVQRWPGATGDEFTIRLAPVAGGPRHNWRNLALYQSWMRRLAYLVLGTGCFLMSIVGIMTPFVPTMPFVVATGYFLALASPTLHDLFRRSPLFGEMLGDWEDLGGWRWSTKRKLLILMVCLWALTIGIAGFSWPLVLTMGLMSSISLITIARMPTIPEHEAVLVGSAS